ncbi:MAG: homoserine dehydrogenase [Clostridium sp.]|nr:homoserine dehydrogenase [Clostridium sp.]
MVNIAILGYGVVGSGVLEIIKKNGAGISKKTGKEVRVKKILDIRDLSDSPERGIITSDSMEIMEDPKIDLVVETIGGIGAAYHLTSEALSRGKHVVTSNKELVATHGPELLELAKQNDVNYLFEASVGGGIPVIRPLNRCLAANEIYSITGILNGTTNYILSRMQKEGRDFADALKEAQEKGYAEADPTADIEGHDACRKIAILSSIAFGEFIDYNNIYTEGISKISSSDILYAQSMGATIKLVAISKKTGGRIWARVSPAIVKKGNPLFGVEDVFNAVVIEGDAIGEVMFYGRGAGKLPTASAVVADMIDIITHHGNFGEYNWCTKERDSIASSDGDRVRYFVRLEAENKVEVQKTVGEVFGSIKWLESSNACTKGELAFVTEKAEEKEHTKSFEAIKENPYVKRLANTIRILDK